VITNLWMELFQALVSSVARVPVSVTRRHSDKDSPQWSDSLLNTQKMTNFERFLS